MILVAAHRGSSGRAPENTMAAFRSAVDDGADLIELDVRFTRDLHPVVLHDRTLRRTTGARDAVDQCSYEDIRDLDAGSWFAPSFAGERIPRLETVLELLPATLGINIEVKTDGDRRSRTLLVRHLLKTVRPAVKNRTIIISSFDHRFLRALRRVDSAIPLGILIHPVRDLARRPSRLALRLRAKYIFCSRSFLRRAIVEAAHARGITIGVYTVNRVENLDRLCRFGVDLVFTNFPTAIRAALREA
ncbi:MAG: glycerophosphoryl diester phosphodiesterase [Bacteroidetes bacterium]|nr:glycerophosphoryl diester phosphodiesterase [Bacteroidota bacterium]